MDFNDRRDLAVKVLNEIFQNEKVGEIFVNLLEEGEYEDDETVCDDIEEIGDSSLVDDMKEHINDELQISWDEKEDKIFYDILRKIFTQQISDYNKLVLSHLYYTLTFSNTKNI